MVPQQNRIYDHPADESRAPELFKNSETWLKFSKLMSFHLECIGDVQEYVGNFAEAEDTFDGEPPVFTWLRTVEQAFTRCPPDASEWMTRDADANLS